MYACYAFISLGERTYIFISGKQSGKVFLIYPRNKDKAFLKAVCEDIANSQSIQTTVKY